MPTPRAARIRKWILRSLAVLVLLMLVAAACAWYWGGPYAQRVIQAKLQKMVSDQLNATLEMGSVQYDYPFGVTVDDVSLVTPYKGAPVTLASFKRLELHLTRLPFGDGPLQIERIELESPTIRIIQTEDGFVGRGQLLRSNQERTHRAAPKLSEIFHLRFLKITNAQAIYEDDRHPDQVPLAWRDLNITLNTQPEGPLHAFMFEGNSGQLATIGGKGKVDLDALIVDLDSINIQTQIAPHQAESPLPPPVTKLLDQYHVAGTASVNITGNVPLTNATGATAKISLKVENATGVHPDFPDPLQDLDLNLSASYGDGDVNLAMEFLSARSGSMGVSVTQFNILCDLDKRSWTASPIRVAVAYAPTEVTRPILDQPATLFMVARAIQLDGLTDVGVDLSGSSLTLPNLNDELKLQSKIESRGDSIVLYPSTLTGLGGRTTFDGWHHTPSQRSAANASVENLSLAAIKTLLKPKEDHELRGKLNADVTARLTGTDLATLTASGSGRITEGSFAKVPVLSSLTNFLRIGQGIFIAKNASARFQIKDQTIRVDRLSASTDAMRIRGEGTITFDEKLDLRVYVIGTGDWGNSVKGTGIPLLSDVGGLLAGSAQGLIRGVTTQFTTVRVKGTIDDPKISPDPAPAITDHVKRLFASD